ncbi:MAG: metallophosphoesterase family protein [Bacteroidota bacterium]
MRLSIISDIHEDITSLEKVLQLSEKEGCDEIICLGDICGFDARYYPYAEKRNANACIDLIKKNCRIAVTGNHDLYALRKIPEFNAGFSYPPDWYSVPDKQRIARSGRKIWAYDENELSSNLNDASVEFLSGLTEFATFNADSKRILFSHFHFPDLSGSTTRMPFVSAHLWAHFRFMREQNCNISFSGHMHPRGIVESTTLRFRIHPNEKISAQKKRQWFGIPNLSSGSPVHGFTMYDTCENTIRFIQLV